MCGMCVLAVDQNSKDYCNLPKLREEFASLRINLNYLKWCQEKKRKKNFKNTKREFYYTASDSAPRTCLNLCNLSVDISVHFITYFVFEYKLRIYHYKTNLITIIMVILFFTDTKNSAGLVGCIEEVSHNAIAIYWNPLESPAKVSFMILFLIQTRVRDAYTSISYIYRRQ
jgi:hypothetical protein